MNDIPREVEVAVREAASAAGGYAGGLDGVYRRARRNRRRRLAVVSAGVATVVALTGLAVTHRPAERPVPPSSGIGPDPAAAPAQRLMLNGANGVYQVTPGLTTGLSDTTQVGELPPDSEIVPHPVAGAERWNQFAGLPDGRIVALGPANLVVTAPDGAVQVNRDVRRPGQVVSLVSADQAAAYLWRPAGLVRHDLKTGRETVLAPRALLGDVISADLAGSRLVFTRKSSPCLPMVYDIAAAKMIGEYSLFTLDCTELANLRMAPDGEHFAFTYRKKDAAQGERLSGIRLSDSAIMLDQWIAGVGDGEPPVDFAWQDDHTLRGVVIPGGTGELTLSPFAIPFD